MHPEAAGAAAISYRLLCSSCTSFSSPARGAQLPVGYGAAESAERAIGSSKYGYAASTRSKS